MKHILAFLLGLVLVVNPAMAANDAPNVVNYQGKLLSAAGTAVTFFKPLRATFLERRAKFSGACPQAFERSARV